MKIRSLNPIFINYFIKILTLKTMKKRTTYLTIGLLLSTLLTFGQEVNNITTFPSNPTANDTTFIISDFSYFGNCSAGLINKQINQSDSVINILAEYCGYGDTTLCNAVDTFSLGILPIGNYSVTIEYHQGITCLGSFDTFIATIDTTIEISTVSTVSSITANKSINIYPNPASDFVKIQNKESIKGIKLFDITGKELKILFNDDRIDIRPLSTGIYILHIELKDGEIRTKEIIKNNAE
ncbi:MAG: T9SS type A sorting domain-containing protein [Vicingaceae bacterium]